MMPPQLLIDTSLERTRLEGFDFPIGVYPVEDMDPRPGYVVEFEAADGTAGFGPGDVAEDWEEWPDRFMYDILVPATRLPALCRALFTLLPSRLFPILDVLGNDAYREVDPYIAYDPVGIERFYDALREFEPWLYEDGLVGFGAMSLEPFIYLFIDEHKVVTARVELEQKDRFERLLAAFDLEMTEEIRGADSAAHEHRGILLHPSEVSEGPPPLTLEEIVEQLRDAWLLQLNVDGATNVDDEGRPLGVTGWRCVVRCLQEDEETPPAYAEVLLAADCLDTAEQLAIDAAGNAHEGSAEWLEVDPVTSDRVTPETFTRLLADSGVTRAFDASTTGVLAVNWMTTEAPPSQEQEPGASGEPPGDRPRAGDGTRGA